MANLICVEHDFLFNKDVASRISQESHIIIVVVIGSDSYVFLVVVDHELAAAVVGVLSDRNALAELAKFVFRSRTVGLNSFSLVCLGK